MPEHLIKPRPISVPWTLREVWLGMLAFGLWFSLLFGGMALIRSRDISVDLGLFISLGQAVLIIPAWWFTVRQYQVSWQTLGLRRFDAAALGLGCGLMLLSLVFNCAYSLLLQPFGLRIQADLVPLFEGLESPWLFLFGGAIIAPFVEEIFFRGFIFAGLYKRYGWQRAGGISAGLFALAHLTPTAILPIFILGFIFAYLYHRSGSIWPAVIMHTATNTLALGAAYVVANAERFGIQQPPL